jgi:hypothetical protein
MIKPAQAGVLISVILGSQIFDVALLLLQIFETQPDKNPIRQPARSSVIVCLQNAGVRENVQILNRTR